MAIRRQLPLLLGGAAVLGGVSVGLFLVFSKFSKRKRSQLKACEEEMPPPKEEKVSSARGFFRNEGEDEKFSAKTMKELRDLIVSTPAEVFAFDFDLTLSCRHCYNAGVTVAQVESGGLDFVREDLPYHEDLRKIFETIEGCGRRWCIVTFGELDVVEAYLRHGQVSTKARIYSPLPRGTRYGPDRCPPANKNPLLSLVVRDIKCKTGEILLFDDDSRNVTAAKAGGFAGAVADRPGMSMFSFMRYLRSASSHMSFPVNNRDTPQLLRTETIESNASHA